MDEKSMLEQIRRSADEIEIPDELKPDAIEKKLRAEQQKNTASGKAVLQKGRSAGRHGRKQWSRYARRASSVAAVLALCICAGAVITTTVLQQKKPSENNSFYGATDDSSLVNNGDTKEPAKEEKKKHTLGEAYYLAGDYGKVYDMLYAWEEQIKWNNAYSGTDNSGVVTEGEKADGPESTGTGAESPDSMLNDSSREDDYSTTNLQTEGVDESDIVKTDGDYIYTLRNNKVVITDIRDNALTEAGTIAPSMKSASDEVREMYVDDNRLILIMERYGGSLIMNETMKNADGTTTEICRDGCYYLDTDYKTAVLTYDISDRSKARLIGSMEQDGAYASSRKIGDKVYLFTNYRVDCDELKRDEALQKEGLNEWLPSAAGEVVDADGIYLPRGGNQGLFMVSMDVSAPSKVIDSKLILNNYAEIYVSADAVYLYSMEYIDRPLTTIVKFELMDNGIIHAVDAGTVRGIITDTFAIHEADGCLRVLTTDWGRNGESTNRLTILGKDMEYVSSIDDIAAGEQIYAARFFGDVGYFVTYRNTDPLFSVDLSDPYAPRLIGELKVTGFSEYLHRWDEDHLIGIGYETDPETGRREGVKLSMFNISDPANVTEEARYVMESEEDSSAMWNYKAVLISKDKNIIGFTTADYDGSNGTAYRAFSYENGSFTEELKVPQADVYGNSYYALNDLRSLYSGHMLYLVAGDKITAYDMENGYTEIK